MMAQWHACKKSSKGALLFFRMGDFYEAFYDDAVVMAKELDLTLTKRQEIPMAGVPHHSCEGYIDRLVAKGYRVAVAEQTEDPKLTKKLVKREVVRLVTPGTISSDSLVGAKRNNFFACVAKQGAIFGLAFIDLTTADFKTCEFEAEQELLDELFRIQPAEFLTAEKLKPHLEALDYPFLTNEKEPWYFDHQTNQSFLTDHFCVHTLDGFGLKGMIAATKAAGALLQFLQNELCLSIDHVQHLLPYSTERFMTMDRMTSRNLDLIDGLLPVIDRTVTPMGGRLMRQWIKQPLLEKEAIEARLDAVSRIPRLDGLDKIRDLERLIMKISSGYAVPRDLIALGASLKQIPYLRASLEKMSGLLHEQREELDELRDVVDLIGTTLADDGAIKEGFSPELDELRGISRDGKSWLANYQAQLREELDIKTLKVGYNRVFGYFLEVSRGLSDRMPEAFERRQTLANSERFISPKLKEYEQKVLSAEDRMALLEAEIFSELRTEVANHAPRILTTARAISVIDCLSGLSLAAKEHNYSRPILDDSCDLIIEEGRHPVIEAVRIGEKFVPNDAHLDAKQQLMLITGPNMAGKSTYIRQVAIIAIMAQMGSFVPASRAHIGLVDKVFTRIGASDDLGRGQSTFMVEMTETASILNNATDRSLVILDEIGRGTSTYDGISIAWSVAEYLLTTSGKKARTLFATHYWELTALEKKIKGAINYNVAVREVEGEVIFLHKIVAGSGDKSYGIAVARLAGLPTAVIARATQILSHLEGGATKVPKRTPKRDNQLTLFDV